MNPINRRRHERFHLAPMYTEVKACPLDKTQPTLLGHAYDISEGGVQFELDRELDPGTPLAVEVTFPTGTIEGTDDGRTIVLVGNIVWKDTSEPGPVRMAMAVTRFARSNDRERLMKQLSKGRLSRAA